MNNQNEWFTVNQLDGDLWSIGDIGFEISYLITGTEHALLIDTGFGVGNIRATVDSITSLPLFIVNTHAHPDHAGGNNQFPEVYLHQDDLRLVHVIFSRAHRENALAFIEKKNIRIDDISGFDINSWLEAKPNTLHPVSHGYVFNLGDREIEVFSIPGHTPGSILLLDRKRGRIFGGDSLIEKHPVWLHLDESAPLHVYHSAIGSLCGITDSFTEVYSAHMTEAISPSVIRDIYNAAGEILSGHAKGRLFSTFSGNGLFHRCNRGAIIYNEANL